jgi:hypothetical protein
MSTRQNSSIIFLGLVCIGSFLLHCAISPFEMAGGASGTEVSLVSGSAVDSDGKAINAAVVTLRPANFLYDSIASKTYIASHTVLDTLTNPDGTYSFRNVRPDTYHIVISYMDSIAVVIPLRVDSTIAVYRLPPDTVMPMATIIGTVSISDSDGDSAQGTVQFYGMDFRAKPDSNGRFIVKIPQGNSKMHIGASEPDSNGMNGMIELDGMDITVGVVYGENKNIGSFNLQPSPPPLCMDGSCDSAVVRKVLDAIGQNTTSIGSVSVVQNGRITGLSLHGKPIFNNKMPRDILQLTALKKIDLGHTGIPVVFPDLPKMRRLEVLLLDSNFCTILPPDIGNLVSLKELNLAGNKLASLPGSITSIKPALLDLSNNLLQNLDSTVSAWADYYDPDWRQTQRP